MRIKNRYFILFFMCSSLSTFSWTMDGESNLEVTSELADTPTAISASQDDKRAALTEELTSMQQLFLEYEKLLLENAALKQNVETLANANEGLSQENAELRRRYVRTPIDYGKGSAYLVDAFMMTSQRGSISGTRR